MEPENMSRQKLEARLAELNEKIANRPRWGAVLTVWDEERLCHEAAAKIERLRAALYEVTTNGRWTEGEQRGEWAISNAVYETMRDALNEQDAPLEDK